jgi:serine/threonine-protein phosphatase 6 regulatory ankyrin repeat subunit B
MNALNLACRNRHLETIKFLLVYNIDANNSNNDGMTSLIWASFKGHQDIAQLLLSIHNNDKLHNGWNCLLWACCNGHFEIVQLLLSLNIDVNQCDIHGFTSLMSASGKGYLDIVQLLLSVHNIDVKKSTYGTSSRGGTTAITEASLKGHIKIVEIIKKYIKYG